MNQPDIPALVREYAKLEHRASLYVAHGQPIPADLNMRMEGLAAWGRANIDPSQFASIIGEKNRIIAELHQQMSTVEQSKDADGRRGRLETAVGKVTRGILGKDKLTPEQLNAVVTRTKLALPKKSLTQAQRDAKIREFTRSIDPKGLGWGEKEYARRMDALVAADPKEFLRLAKLYSTPEDEARKFASKWRNDRMQEALSARRADKDSKYVEVKEPEYHEASDSDHRKATLATAFLTDAAHRAERGDTQDIGDLREAMPQRLLEDDGRRGEMARAWETVDSRGEI